MIKLIRTFLLAGIMLMSFQALILADDKPVSEYTSFEKKIRDKYDSYAVFRWSQYAQLLEKLKEDKFVVMPLNEMRETFDTSKVVVGLRHDVDLNAFRAMEMSTLENFYGIRSTYFFLATAEYYGEIEDSLKLSPVIGDILRAVQRNGSEIGIHNDLLTVMIRYRKDPFEFNRRELEYYKNMGIPIYGTAAHGSPWGKQLGIACYEIFSDFAEKDSVIYDNENYPLGLRSLKDYGFQYEAYKIPFNKYYSESGGKWNDPEGLEGIIKKLESSKPGDRIQILIHPDWWGKQ